jgi:acyl carrier protein
MDYMKALREVLAEHFQVNESIINRGTTLRKELGADKLDMVELIIAFEERIGIDLDIREADTEREVTVGEIIDFLENIVPSSSKRNSEPPSGEWAANGSWIYPMSRCCATHLVQFGQAGWWEGARDCLPPFELRCAGCNVIVWKR